VKPTLILVAALLASLVGCAAPPAETHRRLSSAYAPGPFAVGVQPNFVKDFTRPFDPWGGEYKSDAYRALLAKIDASGEPATVPTQIYYPSPSAGVRVKRRAGLHPSALWAATGGRRHTTLDFFMGDEALADQTLRFWQRRHTYQSFVGAPLAAGKFPQIQSPSDFPDPAALTARKGGGLRAARMMARLFEQRTGDVGAVIGEMKALSAPAPACRAKLEIRGIAKPLCGFFTAAIDAERIGVMGHSLGAITAQSALAFLPEVDTAIAFNNGLPRRWEPFGGFPNPSGATPPDGVPKDFLIVIGSDDAFVHMVFRDIHMQWFTGAGGDLSETYPLAIEQVWPSAGNPQPIARAAYRRAQAAKALIMFRDQGHSTAVDDDLDPEKPGKKAKGRRVPLDRGATGEAFDILAWTRDAGGDIFLPHQMRNYFITAWFDWQLKGDQSQRRAIARHPFPNGVQQLLSEGVYP